MENCPRDLLNMLVVVEKLVQDRRECTNNHSDVSHSPESEDPRSPSGEILCDEPTTSTPQRLSTSTLYEGPDIEADDPFLQQPAPIEESGIPFQLRHRFFKWLIKVLEACYVDFAIARLGRGYIHQTLSEMRLEDVSQLDLSRWAEIMKNACRNGILSSQDFFAYKASRIDIFDGAEAIRHAWIHRRDIVQTYLSDGMCLPELLGDTNRMAKIQHAFDLVENTTASEDHDFSELLDAMDPMLNVSEGEIITQTDLFACWQSTLEVHMFQYAQEHHPEILKIRGWTCPELGEMQEWEYLFRDRALAIESDFPSDTKYLLSYCLSGARYLRNDVAHRHWHDHRGFLCHVHNTIRTLMVLRQYGRAVEVEISAEMWALKTTREQVLLRLRDAYCEGKVENITDGFTRRREESRRAAIAKILCEEVLPTSKTASDNVECHSPRFPDSLPPQTRCPEDNAANCSVPYEIILTPPDDWETRRETFSDSMHSVLKVLTVPEGNSIWNRVTVESDMEWEKAFQQNSNSIDTTDRDDVKEEELDGWDSDATFVEEEHDEEDYDSCSSDDSDDTVVDLEDVDTPHAWEASGSAIEIKHGGDCTPWQTLESAAQIEPGGEWHSTMAVTVGTPW